VERLLTEVWGRAEAGGVAETAALHAAALSGWTLLLTVGGGGGSNVDRLAALLASPHLEVRVAAGEALAVLHETRPLTHDLDQVSSVSFGKSTSLRLSPKQN